MNTITSEPGTARGGQTAVIGVRTTRIYCRPECRPGRSPLPQNCIPFENAKAAREAGFRACKKCRPDEGPKEVLRYGRADTALGPLFAALSEKGVCAIYLCNEGDPEPLVRLRRDFPEAELVEDREAVAGILEKAAAHVVDGESIDDIPLDLRGTEFQRKVWDALRSIPRGTTTTYGELAKSLGLAPGTARAVGSACGTNPVSLIVPCHRVLRAGGGLGGYYWGLERKQAILEAEIPSFRSVDLFSATLDRELVATK